MRSSVGKVKLLHHLLARMAASSLKTSDNTVILVTSSPCAASNTILYICNVIE